MKLNELIKLNNLNQSDFAKEIGVSQTTHSDKKIQAAACTSIISTDEGNAMTNCRGL